MTWTIETLDARVDAEIADLSADMRARLVRISTLLAEFGPSQVREPYIKPLGRKLWEMRLIGKDGIARAVYIAATGQRLIILHVFIKKTQKTPKVAIETALRRAEEAGLR